jgi:hypothetical protein
MMNMIYETTRRDVDKAFYAKNIDHNNFKDQKENSEYMVNASYNGSFKANVGLPRVPSMFLYIIHMGMVLNSKLSLM